MVCGVGSECLTALLRSAFRLEIMLLLATASIFVRGMLIMFSRESATAVI